MIPEALFRRFMAALLLAGGLLGMASCARAPRPSDHVTIVVPYEVTTLDPHATSSLGNLGVLLNMYETLAATDSQMRLVPALAQRWTNPDENTWVFDLRPGVRFHGGKLLDSGDVVFSFQRLIQRRDLMLSGFLVYIDRIEALGPRTVRIVTKRPVSVFLNKISSVAIVPAGSEDASLAVGVNGTGPYRLARYRPGTIELARNERYWGPRPFFRKVTYRLGVPAEQALRLTRSGAVDIAQSNSRPALAAGDRAFRVLRKPDVYLWSLDYDLGREPTPGISGARNPLRDLRVRQAMNLAIDREELVAALAAPETPATQLMPPFVFGYDPSIRLPRPDRRQAVKLLAAAGYPAGFSVRLDVRKPFAEAARKVAAQLGQVGIRATVAEYSLDEFAALGKRRGSSLAFEAFGCTSGDASDLFDNVLHSADASRHLGIFNTGNYANPELDRLIEESAAASEPMLRRSLLQRISRLAMEDLVLLPLYVGEDVFLVRRSLAWRPRDDAMVMAAEIRPADGSGLGPGEQGRSPERSPAALR